MGTQTIQLLFIMAMVVSVFGPPIYLAMSKETWSNFLKSVLFVWLPGSLVEFIINFTQDPPFLHVAFITGGWLFGLIYCYFWYCIVRAVTSDTTPINGSQ